MLQRRSFSCIVLLFLSVSCSKHSDQIPCTSGACTLATVSDNHFVFLYSGSRWSSSLYGTTPDTMSIDYDDRSRIRSLHYSTDPLRIDSFLYNVNNQVIRKSSYYGYADRGDFQDYSYNSTGQLILSHSGLFKSTGDSVANTLSYEYNDTNSRNYTLLTNKNIDGSAVAKFFYDNHPTPYSSISKQINPELQDNNVVKIEYPQPTVTETISIRYSYNSHCYPLTMTQSGWYINPPFTTTFTYQDCPN